MPYTYNQKIPQGGGEGGEEKRLVKFL